MCEIRNENQLKKKKTEKKFFTRKIYPKMFQIEYLLLSKYISDTMTMYISNGKI